MPFFPLYVLALGGSYYHIGIIATIGAFFQVIGSFFGGYLADYVGRKRMIYSMSFLNSLDAILFLISPSWEYLILASAFNALFSGLEDPSVTAIIADSTSLETRTKGFTANQVLRILAGSVSPIIVGILMVNSGIIIAQRIAYACGFVTSMIASLMRFLWLEETLSKKSESSYTVKGVFLDTILSFKNTIKAMPYQVWVIIATGAIFTSGVSIGASFFVTYAVEDVIKLSASEWGMIYAVMSILNVITMILVATLSDKFGRLKLIIPAMFFTPFCIMAFVYSSNLIHVLVVMSILSILGGMIASPIKALLFDYSPKEHRGRVQALSNIISPLPEGNILYQGPTQSVINGVSSIFGGLTYGFSNTLPFYIESVIIGVSAIFGAFMIKESKQNEKKL